LEFGFLAAPPVFCFPRNVEQVTLLMNMVMIVVAADRCLPFRRMAFSH
jgi:hypothetical protein